METHNILSPPPLRGLDLLTYISAGHRALDTRVSLEVSLGLLSVAHDACRIEAIAQEENRRILHYEVAMEIYD